MALHIHCFLDHPLTALVSPFDHNMWSTVATRHCLHLNWRESLWILQRHRWWKPASQVVLQDVLVADWKKSLRGEKNWTLGFDEWLAGSFGWGSVIYWSFGWPALDFYFGLVNWLVVAFLEVQIAASDLCQMLWGVRDSFEFSLRLPLTRWRLRILGTLRYCWRWRS